MKNWTSRSCFSAAARVLKVPRLRRFPVLGSFFLEYRRYPPEASFRIMGCPPPDQGIVKCTAGHGCAGNRSGHMIGLARYPVGTAEASWILAERIQRLEEEYGASRQDVVEMQERHDFTERALLREPDVSPGMLLTPR